MTHPILRLLPQAAPIAPESPLHPRAASKSEASSFDHELAAHGRRKGRAAANDDLPDTAPAKKHADDAGAGHQEPAAPVGHPRKPGHPADSEHQHADAPAADATPPATPNPSTQTTPVPTDTFAPASVGTVPAGPAANPVAIGTGAPAGAAIAPPGVATVPRATATAAAVPARPASSGAVAAAAQPEAQAQPGPTTPAEPPAQAARSILDDVVAAPPPTTAPPAVATAAPAVTPPEMPEATLVPGAPAAPHAGRKKHVEPRAESAFPAKAAKSDAVDQGGADADLPAPSKAGKPAVATAALERDPRDDQPKPAEAVKTAQLETTPQSAQTAPAAPAAAVVAAATVAEAHPAATAGPAKPVVAEAVRGAPAAATQALMREPGHGPANAGRADEVTRLATPQSFDRMLEQLRGEIHKGKDEFRLTLSPPEMGRLDVNIAAKGDGVVLRITAEKSEVAQWLRTDLPILHKAIEKDGMHVLGVEVRTWLQQDSQTSGNQKQDPSAFLGVGDRDLPSRKASSPAAFAAAGRPAARTASSGIDLIV